MEISLKEHWKKAVQAETKARMQKLKEFIESHSSKDGMNQELRPAIDFSQQFHYELWDDEKMRRKLNEYLDKDYDEEKAYAHLVRPWMKAVRQLLEYVTERDLATEGAGVGRETYIFSWKPETFVRDWWQPYLNAVGFKGVTATAPKNCYGVNFGQLVLDYQECRIVLWEWNHDTYFLPYVRADEDITELRCPDYRFLKFRRLTLSAIVEYLRQLPQIAEKAIAVLSLVASFYSEE